MEQARPDDQGPPEINPNELMFDNQHDLIGQGTYVVRSCCCCALLIFIINRFGEVYKAVCRGQRVAVKVPKRQQLTEAQLAGKRARVNNVKTSVLFH